jgi:formylglycine-generating enzyme required for sulfatase activity
VRLDQYYVGVTEVTNAQYEKFDASHRRRRGPSSGGDGPAVNVSWEEAVRFCEWLTTAEGVTYRLPTEAEWEMAARGGDGRLYPWGNDPPGGGGAYRCNLAVRARKGARRDGYVDAAPVGSYKAGASYYGLMDMAGNAAEWCSDWYSRSEYGEGSARANPRGPGSGAARSVRGGSWLSGADEVAVVARTSADPRSRSEAIGFRVVREVPRLAD